MFALQIYKKGDVMFDNVDFKIKSEKLVVSTTGVLGKDKVCEIPLDCISQVKWGKEAKVTLTNLLIKKGHTDIAVSLSGKVKAEAA